MEKLVALAEAKRAMLEAVEELRGEIERGDISYFAYFGVGSGDFKGQTCGNAVGFACNGDVATGLAHIGEYIEERMSTKQNIDKYDVDIDKPN